MNSKLKFELAYFVIAVQLLIYVATWSLLIEEIVEVVEVTIFASIFFQNVIATKIEKRSE